jgi:NAD(P)-dependent dehydrogenase (short-subunit alcohol dehydrogenase family)
MAVLKLFDLSGRKALVTGASRGIGQRLAIALADAGADLAVFARSRADLAQTLAAIQPFGRRTSAFTLDVRDEAACSTAVDAAAAALGDIDILINNAGTEEIRPSVEVDAALWDKILDTNLRGAFFCAQAAAKRMLEAGHGGSIVNLCSLTSHVGIPAAVPYGSSKSGLLGMTRGLAAEWAAHGIRVNAIAPGYFETAMTEIFYRNATWRTEMLKKIPMQRFGKLDDLVGAVVFLASSASNYVTGQCLTVDGGTISSI